MNLDPTDLLLVGGGTLALLWVSRKPLRQPGSHGFYRFFSWEAILLLFALNRRPWGETPLAPHQLASWPLLLASIALVVLGLLALKRNGEANRQRDDGGLYEFEKTTTLVTSGIFRYIRHPMYASLLALTWGAFLQAPSWLGAGLAVFSTANVLLTALSDEKECLAYFGDEYLAYIQRTPRFIPGLF